MTELLAVLDGLRFRGLLQRAQVVMVGGCQVTFGPFVAEQSETTTKQADEEAAKRRAEEEDLLYGSS